MDSPRPRWNALRHRCCTDPPRSYCIYDGHVWHIHRECTRSYNPPAIDIRCCLPSGLSYHVREVRGSVGDERFCVLRVGLYATAGFVLGE